jgi:DivIVA domain-containing protein
MKDLATAEVRFRFTLRGYDPAQVDAALAAAGSAAGSEYESVRSAAAKTLRETEFRVVMRGYAREEVDAYVELFIDEVLLTDAETRAADAAIQAAFSTTLRGYDPEQVDPLLQQVGRALVSKDAGKLTEARAAIQAGNLRMRLLHAYDREQVDQVLTALDRRLALAIDGDHDT